MSTKQKYKLTTYSCFTGIFVQAIITNLTAILFVPFMTLYGLSYKHLGILVAVNFTSQLISDIVFGRLIDKVGFKKLALPAIIIAFLGLLSFASVPLVFKNHIFIGFLISTIIFSSSSGLLEILLSPIIDGINSEGYGNDKEMSLMHSFYAWGQAATIILTSLGLLILGYDKWQLIVIFWTIVPVINFFMFKNSKFPKTPEGHLTENKKLTLKNPIFILCLMSIMFGGTSEVIMNQWTSTFMENALEIPKIYGDLIGMCGFAIMLGSGRALYGIYGDKFDIQKILFRGSLLTALCYLIVALSPIKSISLIACILTGFFVSLLWPGTLVLCSESFKSSGAWIFAALAVFGDLGAAIGPYITGKIIETPFITDNLAFLEQLLNISNEQASIRFAILCAIVFPLMSALCHIIIKKIQKYNATTI